MVPVRGVRGVRRQSWPRVMRCVPAQPFPVVGPPSVRCACPAISRCGPAQRPLCLPSQFPLCARPASSVPAAPFAWWIRAPWNIWWIRMHRIFHVARIYLDHGAGDPGVRRGAGPGGSGSPGPVARSRWTAPPPGRGQPRRPRQRSGPSSLIRPAPGGHLDRGNGRGTVPAAPHARDQREYVPSVLSRLATELRLIWDLDNIPVPRTMNHAVGGVRDQPDPAPRPGLVRAALPGRGAGRGLGTAVRRDQRGRRRLRARPPGARLRGVTGLRGGR